MSWQRDPIGRWTNFQYDALNRSSKTIVNFVSGNPASGSTGTDIISTTSYRADSTVDHTVSNYVDGAFTATQPITDTITQFGYDPLSRLTSTTLNYDPPMLGTRTDTNRTSGVSYDPTTGRELGQQEALGRWVSNQYDSIGQLTTTIANCRDTKGNRPHSSVRHSAAALPIGMCPAARTMMR